MISFSVSGNEVDWGFSEFEGGWTLFLRRLSEMQMTAKLSKNPLFSKRKKPALWSIYGVDKTGSSIYFWRKRNQFLIMEHLCRITVAALALQLLTGCLDAIANCRYAQTP